MLKYIYILFYFHLLTLETIFCQPVDFETTASAINRTLQSRYKISKNLPRIFGTDFWEAIFDYFDYGDSDEYYDTKPIIVCRPANCTINFNNQTSSGISSNVDSNQQSTTTTTVVTPGATTTVVTPSEIPPDSSTQSPETTLPPENSDAMPTAVPIL